jgi:hypothetical protein
MEREQLSVEEMGKAVIASLGWFGCRVNEAGSDFIEDALFLSLVSAEVMLLVVQAEAGSKALSEEVELFRSSAKEVAGKYYATRPFGWRFSKGSPGSN